LDLGVDGLFAFPETSVALPAANCRSLTSFGMTIYLGAGVESHPFDFAQGGSCAQNAQGWGSLGTGSEQKQVLRFAQDDSFMDCE